jgi:hypothetical protein
VCVLWWWSRAPAGLLAGSGQGPGVYVDQIVAADRNGVLFQGEGDNDASRLIADRWSPARD